TSERPRHYAATALSDALHLLAFDEPDQMALGVIEEPDRGPLRHFHRAHDPRAAEALRLLQPLLDILDRDVEGHPSVAALLCRAHAAADADSLVEILLPLDHAVLHRVVRVDLPPEELGI